MAFFQRAAIARLQPPLALRPRVDRAALVGEIALAGERLLDHAHHRPAVLLQADQRAPDRHPGNEGARAVDRIDDPDIFAVEPNIAVLLAENAVLGKVLFDQRPDRRFRSAVALRHRIEAARQLVR